jgi:hypothetical protein
VLLILVLIPVFFLFKEKLMGEFRDFKSTKYGGLNQLAFTHLITSPFPQNLGIEGKSQLQHITHRKWP